MRNGKTLSFLFIFLLATILPAKTYRLYSPNQKLNLQIQVKDIISFSLRHDNIHLLSAAPLSITLKEFGQLGKNGEVIRARRKEVNTTIDPVVRQKSSQITNRYNQLRLTFKGNYALTFRVFNSGIAYRWETDIAENITVINEGSTVTFNKQDRIYFPEEKSFMSHNERTYAYLDIQNIAPPRFCSLPVLVDSASGIKILLTETDLEDYPGMWLQGTGTLSLKAIFPAFPLEEKLMRDRDLQVTQRANYIARTRGQRSFPWRILAVANNDRQLITNQLTFLLAKANRIKDPSWIKPGKVAWDWWNFNNIYNVPFKAGVNTDTYKYYIDFASRYGIEYIILDEGWYKLGNLLDINPEIDMEAILAHARKKNVGIILWVVWKTLDDQMQEAMDQFEKWGVKGIKVDFMQRDDQKIVNYYHKVASEAARRKMVVDFHGSYKPSGLHRTYPNVLTCEGVKGLENTKWSNLPDPEHDVTLPFIRMVAGPMDYTPGAMINSQKENFRPIFKRPMSIGTRCHQLAMYVVFESPLQMMCDSPANYLREPECTRFISKIPTVWDQTLVLEARVGDYVVITRKNGLTWYVGAMTDDQGREFTIPLTFLDKGKNYQAEIFQDGINAHRFGNDYKYLKKVVTSTDSLHIKMATGGGWAAILELKN